MVQCILSIKRFILAFVVYFMCALRLSVQGWALMASGYRSNPSLTPDATAESQERARERERERERGKESGRFACDIPCRLLVEVRASPEASCWQSPSV